MSRSWVRPVLLIVVPSLAVVAALGVWLWSGRYVTTENAYVKLDIAKVAAEVSGRIKNVLIEDHADVARGDILIQLNDDPFTIKLAAAEAEVDAARNEVSTMIARWREALSELRQAEGQILYWETQLKRIRRLKKRKVVSSSRLEEVENSAREARDRVTVTKNKVMRMLSQIGGDAERPIDQHPLVRTKIAVRDAAALDLKRTVIHAPIAGTVVNVKIQPGEHVEPDKPLFALVAANRPWVEANFKETELTHILPGMAATVVLDIYPDFEWKARVGSISPATGAEFALLPPQNASGNWVKVVQRLPVRIYFEPQADEPPLRAGMTATVSIDTKRQRKLASLFGGFVANATKNSPEAPQPSTTAKQ